METSDRTIAYLLDRIERLEAELGGKPVPKPLTVTPGELYYSERNTSDVPWEALTEEGKAAYEAEATAKQGEY